MPRSDTAPRMTTRDWIIQILGWLALLASLALLSPGVVATANAEPTESEQAGPTCEPGAPGTRASAPERVVVGAEQMVEAIRLQALAQADALIDSGAVAGDVVIPLDGRGYNYRNEPYREPAPAR